MHLEVATLVYNVILGLPWLKRHNPKVNWEEGTLELLRDTTVSALTTVDEPRSLDESLDPFEDLIASIIVLLVSTLSRKHSTFSETLPCNGLTLLLEITLALLLLKKICKRLSLKNTGNSPMSSSRRILTLCLRTQNSITLSILKTHSNHRRARSIPFLLENKLNLIPSWKKTSQLGEYVPLNHHKQPPSSSHQRCLKQMLLDKTLDFDLFRTTVTSMRTPFVIDIPSPSSPKSFRIPNSKPPNTLHCHRHPMGIQQHSDQRRR